MANIPLKIVRIHNSQFKCNYLKNERIFLIFLFHFWNLHQILNALKETMILIGNVFSKLETVKILLIPLSKKRRFRTRFDSQHVKASHILARSQSEHFCHPFPSFSGKLIWKMSAIALGEVLVCLLKDWLPMASILFKIVGVCNSQFKWYYVENEKLFLNFLLNFWNLHQILNILKERMIVIDHVFPKLETVKIFLIPLSKKRRFRTRFDSQQVKTSQIPSKSPWEHFCHVFSSFSWEVDLDKVSPSVRWRLSGVC